MVAEDRPVSFRGRAESPTVDPRKFVMRSLCENPEIDQTTLLAKLTRRGFPVSGQGRFEQIFEDVQQTVRMPVHMHDLIVAIYSKKDVKENSLKIDRFMRSMETKGISREKTEHRLSAWTQLCVKPLVDTTDQTACSLNEETNEWTLDAERSRFVFCSEYTHSLLRI